VAQQQCLQLLACLQSRPHRIFSAARKIAQAPNATAMSRTADVRQSHVSAPPLNSVAASASSPSTLTLRARFRKSRDYAALVDEIASAARSGDPEAGYLMAEALKYCDQNIKRFFSKPDGSTRALNDAQIKWANRPAGYQEEIVDVYNRCHSFIDNTERKSETALWSTWLDKEAAAGYPAAEAQQADDMRTAAVLAAANRSSQGADASSTLARARNLALSAAQSGDPDALITMANWVDAKKHSPEDYGNLVSAWQLAACQRGYDCGENSDWLRSLCNWDPQCGNDETVEDYLQRQLGTRFDDVKNLADAIGSTVDAKNAAGIESYL